MGNLEKKKREDIVLNRNRDFPVLRDKDLGEDPEVIDVEVVPVKSNADHFKKWIVLFLTTALFWTVVFAAAWLNHLMTR